MESGKMTNLFKQASVRISGVIIFVWPLSILLVGLALLLMYEDYQTSRLGYLALPTAKASGGMITFAVAALPQAGQIVLFYIFGRDTKQRWAILLALLLFFADIGTDVWFKSKGDLWLVPVATIESLFLFTLGSEMLFTIAVGFVTEGLPEFVIAISKLFAAIGASFGSALDNLDSKND